MKHINYFEEDVWKNEREKRKKYIRFLLNDVEVIGKTKKDIYRLLGDEGNYFPEDRWTYFIKKTWWYGNKFLAVYFQDGEVNKVKIELFK